MLTSMHGLNMALASKVPEHVYNTTMAVGRMWTTLPPKGTRRSPPDAGYRWRLGLATETGVFTSDEAAQGWSPLHVGDGSDAAVGAEQSSSCIWSRVWWFSLKLLMGETGRAVLNLIC